MKNVLFPFAPEETKEPPPLSMPGMKSSKVRQAILPSGTVNFGKDNS